MTAALSNQPHEGGAVAPAKGGCEVCATAPAHPTPISEIVAALRKVEGLQDLAEGEYSWLASHGTERIAEDRAVVFREDEPAHHLNIILKGEIYVHRRNSGSVSLFIGRTGQVTGKLPFSRMTAWAAEGSSSGYLWVLDIHEDLFPEMLLAIPSMAQRCVWILLDRTRDFTRADQQAEKLVALGKLAANLSHELNNPASAAQRAALRLSSMIDRDQELCALGRSFRSDEELSTYVARSRGEMAFVEIWDNGVGIDAALSTRIFEPFFTTKPLGQGLGLGLDTVRRIVSKHFG